MRYHRFILLSIVLFPCCFLPGLYGQHADAGPNRYTCVGIPIKIGPEVTHSDWCYLWIPPDGELGISDKSSPNPIITPEKEGSYTFILDVTGNDFGFREFDAMILEVLPSSKCCSENTLAPIKEVINEIGVDTGNSSCLPLLTSIKWDVCLEPTTETWHARVDSLVCSGKIKIRQWPNFPNTIITPNTPNPVDSGNIINFPGSKNHWLYAISDLADMNTIGGGFGPDWDDIISHYLHEYYHWDIDWLASCVVPLWGATEGAVETLNTSSLNETAIGAWLIFNPSINTIEAQLMTSAMEIWVNTILPKDKPGLGGGAYHASQVFLNEHITAINAYANSKGWQTPVIDTTDTTLYAPIAEDITDIRDMSDKANIYSLDIQIHSDAEFNLVKGIPIDIGIRNNDARTIQLYNNFAPYSCSFKVKLKLKSEDKIIEIVPKLQIPPAVTPEPGNMWITLKQKETFHIQIDIGDQILNPGNYLLTIEYINNIVIISENGSKAYSTDDSWISNTIEFIVK